MVSRSRAQPKHRPNLWLLASWDGWKYLFTDDGDSSFGNTLNRFWCRLTGHRDVFFYNPGGLEPDMTCKGCGADLG